MAFAETANLAVKLTLGGNFTSQLAKSRAALRGFDKDASRAYKMGGQIGTGIRRGALLAVAGIGALTALVAQSVREGQEAAKVQAIYANAIANSGKVSQDYVKILNAQQLALMNLAGVDDELIKTEQTRLIQMGLTGKQVAILTPLILDFAEATGVDLLTATKLAGKAAQGNTGALSRYGVMVDKTKAKVDPFAATVEALNGKFGGTSKALGGSLEKRLAALREGLANIREEAGMRLLPVLTRIVDMAGKELVPAFAKFVDRIMPQVEEGLNTFAGLLSDGGAARGIQAITDALGPMVELVKVAAAPVKAIVGAFLALPKEVQTVLVGAFAVNKLTGGLVTTAAGGIVEAIAKAALGGIKAPLVNVTGGVVNVGGAPGIGGGVAGAAKGGLGMLSKVFLVGEAIGLALLVNEVRTGIADASTKQAAAIETQTARFIASQPNKAELSNALAGVERGIHDLEANPLNVLVQGEALDKLRGMRADLRAALNDIGPSGRDSTTQAETTKGNVFGPTGLAQSITDAQAAAATKITTSVETMRGKIAAELMTVDGSTVAAGGLTSVAARDAGMTAANAARIAGYNVASAIRSKDMSFSTSVVVNVTAAGVTKSVTEQSRYGPGNGSAGGGSGPPGMGGR